MLLLPWALLPWAPFLRPPEPFRALEWLPAEIRPAVRGADDEEAEEAEEEEGRFAARRAPRTFRLARVVRDRRRSVCWYHATI